MVAEGPTGHLVIATTDAFVKSLAASDDATLSEIAEPWSHTTELEGTPADRLAAKLHELRPSRAPRGATRPGSTAGSGTAPSA